MIEVGIYTVENDKITQGRVLLQRAVDIPTRDREGALIKLLFPAPPLNYFDN